MVKGVDLKQLGVDQVKRYANRMWPFVAAMALWFLVSFSAVAQTTIRLRVADSFPPAHHQSRDGIVFWMNRVTELTSGRVQFDYFPAEQLGKISDMLDLAQNRVADITYVGPAYFTDRMPLSGVTELPGSFSAAQEGTRAFWRLIEEYLLEAEFLPNGVRPLYGVMLPPYQLATVPRPVVNLDDLRGLKVFTARGTQELVVRQLGAVPVTLPAPELYIALQRGMLDGAVGAISSIKPYNLHELLKHATTNLNLGSFAVTFVINEQLWKTLPPEIKSAMQKAGEETRAHLSRVLDEREAASARELAGLGIHVYSVPDSLVAAISERVRPVWAEWAERLNRRGRRGTEAVRAWEKALLP